MPFAQINNIDIHYEVISSLEATKNEPILVFLHEALGSIPQWKDFPQLLCDQLKLNGIIYERQGYGKSSPLSKMRNVFYLHEYALQELPLLLNYLFSKSQKFILVGHSDGGSIALLFAAKFPEIVQAVITMAAHVINESKTIAGIAPAVYAFENGKLDKLHDYHGKETRNLFYAWADTWNTKDFQNWDICDDITTIDCPSLILQGINDQYGTIRQVHLIEDSIRSRCTTYLIDKCGHHPHLEQKLKTINLITNWCSRSLTLSNIRPS